MLAKTRFSTALTLCLLPVLGLAQSVPNISRWTGSTALTPPRGYSQGSPLTLTWSIVPDGTTTSGGGASNLIARFDATFGAGPGGTDLTQRPWFNHFANSFNRWSQLTGLSYQYSPQDDGIAQSGTNLGVLGVRGDVRIGGRSVDGQGGTLAFNSFPNNGDMVIDTDDMPLYGQSANSFRFLRNVIMHEHGHGMGQAHVICTGCDALMEPFLQTNFDGPQFHDILIAHRGYGDVFEKANAGQGNETAALAIPLGTLTVGSTISIGNDARDLPVGPNEVDFVSIDDQTDIDYWSFSLGQPATMNILLEALGHTYDVGPQGGTQISWNTRERSDLSLDLFGSDGSTLIQGSNLTGLGGNESLSLALGTGLYFLRISGLENPDSSLVDPQFYGLTLQAVPEPTTLAAMAAGLALLLRRRRSA